MNFGEVAPKLGVNQEGRLAMATICSYEDPQTLEQYYDNLTLLLGYVKALFSVLMEATEGQSDDISYTAHLREELCKDLHDRAEALYKFAARKTS